jgi:hypothetical protein
MPNAFAYLVLFSWPLVAIVLFRKLPLHKALIWTVMGGYLILPVGTGIKIPMIPLFDKTLIPSLSALILCLIYAPRPEAAHRGLRPTDSGRTMILGLIAIMVIAPFMSVLQNPEPIIAGPRFITGLRLYDGFSMLSGIFVDLIPFVLGWRYLNTSESQAYFLRFLVIAALFYSLPAMFEVRVSPQLHNWIYGFFPHDFGQHMRAGGFRPVVFLSHGLLLGIFLCMATLASLILWREALREGKTASVWIFALVWLVIVLILSKNLGALAITILLAPFIIFAGQKLQVTAAVVVAGIVLFYPMLRSAGYVPVEQVYEMALSISQDRASSLRFRLDNEDALLAHAAEKPWFGWGNWGRNHLYDPSDGRMSSVTDGIWVIIIGTSGWFGYIGSFGLLTLPVLLYALRRQKLGPSLITPGLMVVLSATLLDMLPNDGLVSYVWLMAGALTGFVLRQSEEDAVPSPAAPRLAERGKSAPGWLAPRTGAAAVPRRSRRSGIKG